MKRVTALAASILFPFSFLNAQEYNYGPSEDPDDIISVVSNTVTAFAGNSQVLKISFDEIKCKERYASRNVVDGVVRVGDTQLHFQFLRANPETQVLLPKLPLTTKISVDTNVYGNCELGKADLKVVNPEAFDTTGKETDNAALAAKHAPVLYPSNSQIEGGNFSEQSPLAMAYQFHKNSEGSVLEYYVAYSQPFFPPLSSNDERIDILNKKIARDGYLEAIQPIYKISFNLSGAVVSREYLERKTYLGALISSSNGDWQTFDGEFFQWGSRPVLYETGNYTYTKNPSANQEKKDSRVFALAPNLDLSGCRQIGPCFLDARNWVRDFNRHALHYSIHGFNTNTRTSALSR